MSQSLENLAIATHRFPDLSNAERALLRAASTMDYASLDEYKDNDPRRGSDWPRPRTIRGTLIRWICVDKQARELVDPIGIQVFGAKISETLDLTSAKVPFPLTFHQCRFMGELNISGGQVTELDLDGTYVESLYLNRTKVDGSVFLRDSFETPNSVHLHGAELRGDLECDGGSFEGGLIADGIKVSCSIFLRKKFRSKLVRLANASIGGSLECDGGSFGSDRMTDALDASGAIVKGDVFLRRSFSSEGNIMLVGTQIGGDLDCTEGRIHGELDARRATINGAFIWSEIVDPKDAVLILRDASAYSLRDDCLSWPSKGHLWIEGFTYKSERQLREPAGHRTDWLSRMVPFSPQPYQQMANVKRDSGDEGESVVVLVEMERRRRNGYTLAGPINDTLRWTIGYGYHPLWAFWELAGLAGLGWIIYRRANLARAMKPTDKDAYKWQEEHDGILPDYYPRFSPLVYSVENSLPLVNLGQNDHWQPDPNPKSQPRKRLWDRLAIARVGQLLVSPRDLLRAFVTATASPVFARRFLWCQIILGWILATLFAAGVTGIIHTR